MSDSKSTLTVVYILQTVILLCVLVYLLWVVSSRQVQTLQLKPDTNTHVSLTTPLVVPEQSSLKPISPTLSGQ